MSIKNSISLNCYCSIIYANINEIAVGAKRTSIGVLASYLWIALIVATLVA